MLRVYHLFLGAILLALTPLGVKTILPRFSTAVVENPSSVAMKTQTKSPQPTASKTSNPRQGNTWNQILGNTPTPNGWGVVPCEGNDPLLCVSSQGKLLGTVEIAVYPVKNNSNFQKNLRDAGIPLDSQVDYQSPEYQNKLLTALKAWVVDLNSYFCERPSRIPIKTKLCSQPTHHNRHQLVNFKEYATGLSESSQRVEYKSNISVMLPSMVRLCM